MRPTYDYAARNKDGRIHIFIGKPVRHLGGWAETDEYAEYAIPEPFEMPIEFLPELTWDNEPIEIEIVPKIR